MSAEASKPEELLKQIDYKPPKKSWLEPRVEFRKGTYLHAPPPKHLEYLGLPNPREWQPYEEEWELPQNWKQIILEGMKDQSNKYRSFQLFLDICVRCGACAEKCPFFIGSGDPKNMPVLRAELLRSVYRKYFMLAGKLFGKLAGARELTEDVIEEWFCYFYQCTECRCSIFCSYGIDTCEITMMARELLNLLGYSVNWIIDPAAKCYRTGSHLGVPPHAFTEVVETGIDDIKEVTGIKVEAPINKKGLRSSLLLPLVTTSALPIGLLSWVISCFSTKSGSIIPGAPMLPRVETLAFSILPS